MKKIRKHLCFLITFLMIFQVIAALNLKVVIANDKKDTIAKLRILQLMDSEKIATNKWNESADSSLPYPTSIVKYKPSKSEYTDIEITTMSMKTFVAMREEINGRYDVIYLSSGKYSTATSNENVSFRNFNGQLNGGTNSNVVNDIDAATVINDITELKVKEISEFLKDAHNYLLIHQDIRDGIGIDTNSLVYKTYSSVTAPTKTIAANILVINSKDSKGLTTEEAEAANFYRELLKTSITNSVAIHPNLTQVNGMNESVENGERKQITFKISNATYLTGKLKEVKVYLYADRNTNGFFEASELVAQNTIGSLESNDTVYSIAYIPTGTYKNIPLKLEAVATNGDNHTKFYQTGLYTFIGEKLNLNVLQILGQGAAYLPSFDSNHYNVWIDGRYMQQNAPNGNRNKLLFEFKADEIRTNSQDPFEQKVYNKIVETKKLTNPAYTLLSYNSENSTEQLRLYNEAKLACYVEAYDVLLLGISNNRYLMNITTEFSGLPDNQKNQYYIYFEKLTQAFRDNPNKRIVFTRDVFRKEAYDKLSTAITQNFSGQLSGNSSLTITANGTVKSQRIITVNKGILDRPRAFNANNVSLDFQGVFRLNLNEKNCVVWYNCATGGGDNSYDLYHTYCVNNLVFTQAGTEEPDKELIRNILLMAGQGINKTTIKGRITISPKPIRLELDQPILKIGTLTANILSVDLGATVHWYFSDAFGKEVTSNGCLDNTSLPDGNVLTINAAKEGIAYITAYYQKENNTAGQKFLDTVQIIVTNSSDVKGTISPIKDGDITLKFTVGNTGDIKYENFNLKVIASDPNNNISIKKIEIDKSFDSVKDVVQTTDTLMNQQQIFVLGKYIASEDNEIIIHIIPYYRKKLDEYAIAVKNNEKIVIEAIISADKYVKNYNYGEIGHEDEPKYNLEQVEDIMTRTGIEVEYINIPQIQ